MASSSAFFLLLSSLLRQSLASPVGLQQRDSINSNVSTLVVTATTGDLPVVTFYPSQVSDSSLWTLSTSITITSPSSTEVVGPLGYEWVASPSAAFPLPAIPTDAPYAIPGNISTTLLQPLSSSALVPPGTGAPSSASIPHGTGASSILPPFPTASSVVAGPSTVPGTGVPIPSSSSSVPLGTGASSILPPFPTASSVVAGPSTVPGTGVPIPPSSSSVPLGTGVTSSIPLPVSSTGSTAFSGTSASSSAPGDSSASGSGSSAPVSGIWSATPTEPTEAFPSYNAPTGVITGAAATSEAAHLSGLFFAIYTNRNFITDSNLKQEYIDNVRKTKEEADSLFNALDVKPMPDPECSNLKRKRYVISERRLRLLIAKRSLISGLTDLVGDAAKLLSCATKVVDNLVKAVEASEPPISEIETLTDTLKEIAQDLQKEDKNPSNSPSESQQPSTQESTASSSASCTASSAVPRCTETVTLSTSFFSGTTGSSTVQSITTDVCTTITACDESASTAFTTVSTATSTSGIVCATDCAKCANPVVKRDNSLYQRKLLEKRTLADPANFDSANQYVMDQIEKFPGVESLEHKHTGRFSTAMTRPFEKTPRRLYVAGLFGCTSVVIVSEMGVWFSHHWEAPSFKGDDATFERDVLSTIRDGDPDDPVRMPGPFPLAEGDGILNPKFKVQIFISTPKKPEDGKEIFETRVNKIVDLLTGEGKPWAGTVPVRRGYPKPTTDREQDQFALRANSKVLIEYDNDQEAPFGEAPKPNKQAAYRVWLEQQMYEHQWDAKADIQKDAACSNPKQKRQDVRSCGQSAASSGASEASTGPTGSSSGTGSTGAPSQPTNSTTGPPPSSSTAPAPSSTSVPPSTTNPPSSTTAASTTAPLGSDSASCSPTTDNAASLPSGDITGKFEPFCERINGNKISATSYNYNDTSSWSGKNDGVFGLALTINWRDRCVGDGTIQSQDCKNTFQKIVDDCEPKTAPSGWPLQKYGGNILGFACVNYGVQIINGNVFDPATSPVAPPDASSTAPPPTSTTQAPPTATVCSDGMYDGFDACAAKCYQGACQENAGQPQITCSCN